MSFLRVISDWTVVFSFHPGLPFAPRRLLSMNSIPSFPCTHCLIGRIELFDVKLNSFLDLAVLDSSDWDQSEDKAVNEAEILDLEEPRYKDLVRLVVTKSILITLNSLLS